MAQRRYNTAPRPGRAGSGAAQRVVVGMATKHSRRGLSRPSNPGAGIPAGGVLPPPPPRPFASRRACALRDYKAARLVLL
jgi:hypothetical protein